MAKATDKGGAAGTDPAPTNPDPVARLTGAAAPPDPVPESELDTLRRERAELVRERDEMRHRAEVAEAVADRLTAPGRVAAAAAPVPPRGVGPAVVHGAGDCLWAGRVPKDPLAPRVAFRTPTESVGDAKDAYLRHAGILATEHPVEVTRADG